MWVFGLLAGLCYVVPAVSLPPQSEGNLSVDPLNVTMSANTWTGRENGQLFCGECGESQVSVMKIIGGRPASEGEYPWMVYLGVGCGGTLIKKQWVLTAAHCYAGVSNPKKYSIILGRTDYTQNTPGSLILKPIKVFIHRNYNPLNFKNDIALLKLPYALDFTDTIKPLCVARGKDLEFGVTAVATGWGVTQLGATNIPKRLREVTLDITSKAQCKKLASASPKFFICTLTKNKDACQGDSGGPLMVQGSSGKWTQVGIVSHGEGCALKNAPGVYTKVSAYTSWIKKKTRSSGC